MWILRPDHCNSGKLGVSSQKGNGLGTGECPRHHHCGHAVTGTGVNQHMTSQSKAPGAQRTRFPKPSPDAEIKYLALEMEQSNTIARISGVS